MNWQKKVKSNLKMKKSKLIIDFSGSIEIDSEEIQFVHIENDDDIISGTEYMNLSEELRSEFVLKSFLDTYMNGKSSIDFLDIIKD